MAQIQEHGDGLIFSARDCAEQLRALSGGDESLLAAAKARLRPYSCPFEEIVQLVPPGSRVLDIGCGAGYLLLLLAALERSVSGIGVDQSAAAIRDASRMAERCVKRSSLAFRTVAGFEEWPDEQFDVVTVIDVLHHVPRRLQEEFLRQACRKVRPGGTLLYKDMCVRPLWRRAANRLHDLVLAGQWVREMSPETVERTITPLGFGCQSRQRLNRLWYGHDLLVFLRGFGM